MVAMNSIHEPARNIPVIAEVDLCVLGGSCTGVFAAVRAARRGLRVALVEKTNRFGGVATNGLVCCWHNDLDDNYEERIVAGLSLETVERLQRRDAVTVRERNPNVRYIFNTEELTIELDELVREAGITPFLHTVYCRAILEDDASTSSPPPLGADAGRNNEQPSRRLQAVLVENKDGRGAIRAAVFIDATGDGDLAKDCGAPYTVRPDLQPPTTCAKISGLEGLDMCTFYNEHRGEFGLPEDAGWSTGIPGAGPVQMHAETHCFGANVADATQLTAAEMEGRRHIRGMMDMVRRYLPERRQQLCLLDLASSIGTRETRRFAVGSSRYTSTLSNEPKTASIATASHGAYSRGHG